MQENCFPLQAVLQIGATKKLHPGLSEAWAAVGYLENSEYNGGKEEVLSQDGLKCGIHIVVLACLQAVDFFSERKMNKHTLVPVTVGIVLVVLVAVVALTDLLSPLIVYLHNKDITPLEGILCVAFGILGFYLVFKILVKLGDIMLPDA